MLPFYPAFLAAMSLVVLAADAFSFLVAWELMSLASWALVMSRHREPANAQGRPTSISSWRASARSACCWPSACWPAPAAPMPSPPSAPMRRRAGTAAIVLALAILGAGSKAGLVPLHVWLPLAHPAAPSHVSALMSGVMTKVAVYAFVRIVVRSRRPAGVVVGARRADAGGGHRNHRRAAGADATRPEAAARLSHGREHRHHLHRARAGARLPRRRPAARGGAGDDRRPVPRASTTRCSRACCSSARARCWAPPASATWSSLAV